MRGLKKIIGQLDKQLSLDEAACGGMDTDIFFPEHLTKENANLAKEVCSGCPIALQCLTFAVVNTEHGIWGGSTLEERKRLRQPERRVEFVVNLRNKYGK
jgi:WhiB family redox-sensing transcriptional regulator